MLFYSVISRTVNMTYVFISTYCIELYLKHLSRDLFFNCSVCRELRTIFTESEQLVKSLKFNIITEFVYLCLFVCGHVTVVGRTPDKGAATSINAAVNPSLNTQQHIYYDSCKPKQSSADSRWAGDLVKGSR